MTVDHRSQREERLSGKGVESLQSDAVSSTANDLGTKPLGNLSSMNTDWTPAEFDGLEMGALKARRIK